MINFKAVPIGSKFKLNGNLYIKVSTRTAKPLFNCHIGYFYIGINEVVKEA